MDAPSSARGSPFLVFDARTDLAVIMPQLCRERSEAMTDSPKLFRVTLEVADLESRWLPPSCWAQR